MKLASEHLYLCTTRALCHSLDVPDSTELIIIGDTPPLPQPIHPNARPTPPLPQPIHPNARLVHQICVIQQATETRLNACHLFITLHSITLKFYLDFLYMQHVTILRPLLTSCEMIKCTTAKS